MASSFSCFIVPFFIFFVFPNLSCPCPSNNLPCGDPPIEIRYPFYTNTTPPNCRGSHMIWCHDSTPIVQFYGHSLPYIMKKINYTEWSIIIQDQECRNNLQIPDCIFFYEFFPFIPLPNTSIFLPPSASQNRSSNCKRDDYDICANISHEIHDRNFCKDHEKYSSNKLEDEGSCQDECRASRSPSFVWKLFFIPDGGLFLQFASNYLHLWDIDWGCVKHNTAGQSNTRTKIAIGVGAGVGGMIAAGLLCLLWYKHGKRNQRLTSSILLAQTASPEPSSNRDPKLGSSQYQTPIFSCEELDEATNGFSTSRELGGGCFGIVYQGKLQDGRVVAVKRLYNHDLKNVEQFMNEVEILSRLCHQNLVSLYGCTSRCSRELLLVYEYVPNGTVADHLHGSRAHDRALTWPIRMSIAIETADALAYLHAVEPQVIHRDVKTSNILLDSSFHVKVADFGLSRLFPLDATHVSTAPQGTPGYVDPFYHQCYQLTDKSDVYSFGVVLAELISAKPAVDTNRTLLEINLSNMTISKIQNCQLEQLVDPSLGYRSDWEMKTMITRVAELAFRCLQLEREMRPIKEVLEVLRGIESGEYKNKKVVEAAVPVREDASLPNNVLPHSPDSVTGRWESRSTTPHASE